MPLATLYSLSLTLREVMSNLDGFFCQTFFHISTVCYSENDSEMTFIGACGLNDTSLL